MVEMQLKDRVAEHVRAVEQLAGQTEVVRRICDLLIETYRAGKRVWLAGNGGSDADAQHVAAELIVRLFHNRQALPAVALSAGGAVGSSIGNDFAFEDVFGRQLEGLAQAGDVLWVFSTSGKSPNIIKAAMVAQAKGCKVILFTGPSGGPVAKLSDSVLHAQAGRTDLIQEVHQVAYHYICQQVEAAFIAKG